MGRYRQIRVLSRSSRAAPDAAAALVLEGTTQLPESLGPLDQQTGGALAEAIARPEVTGAAGETTTVYPQAGPGRLFVIGLGKSQRLDGNAVRAAAGKALALAHAAGVKRLALDPGEAAAYRPAEEIGAALGDGLALGNERFEQFKGAASGESATTQAQAELRATVPDAHRSAFQRALTIGEGVTTARQLAATPPNVAHPAYMAEQCRKLARRTGLTCQVIDQKRAAELNMGGLLAVGRAGSTPPAVIALEWPGQQAAGQTRGKKKKTAGTRHMQAKPLMLVGKAITFDTGGYSLKPSSGMKGMKYDKCGGTNVIGAMEAIARLKLKQRVVGLIPCAENMIDQQAYRVDDILTLANGVTVEVGNTDAEGRLVLADAMAWGTQQYDPAAVVDMGTLTGGIVVALGKFSAGLFCPDDTLRDRLTQASAQTGEKVWPMPLWHEHRDQMQSPHADIVNAADRKAHPIQCAAFLSHFVGSDAPRDIPRTPWAHLDIAGVADVEEDSALYAKGPTGFGVRMLTELARQWPKRG